MKLHHPQHFHSFSSLLADPANQLPVLHNYYKHPDRVLLV